MTGTQDPGLMWAAEVGVTARLAADLIRGQFPALHARVTELETGWDNTAFLVDEDWLFRFPRREVALPGIRREIAVLPVLAPSLPLAIPVPELIGAPTADYPWQFWGARLLPGRELAESGLADTDRGAAAVAMGHFLRRLHEPDLAALVGDGLQIDPMRRGSPPHRARMARDAVARLVTGGVIPASPAIDSLLDRAARTPEMPADELAAARGRLVVTHGDLHLRHVLVGDDGAATGVIDWGDLCLADPAVDLMIAYSAFVGQPRAELLAAYGDPIGADRELAARMCAVSVCAALAEYAAAEQRTVLLGEAIAALGRAVAA